MNTIEINASEIPLALSCDSLVILVRKDKFGRERKNFLDKASSDDCSFFTKDRGFIRIDCEPSESHKMIRNILAA